MRPVSVIEPVGGLMFVMKNVALPVTSIISDTPTSDAGGRSNDVVADMKFWPGG